MNYFLPSIRDSLIASIASTMALFIVITAYSPQAHVGVGDFLILGGCCGAVIAFFGSPLNYYVRSRFKPSGNLRNFILLLMIGVILSQIIVFIATVTLLGSASDTMTVAIASSYDALYRNSWQGISIAAAVAGGILGGLSVWTRSDSMA